jgi:hypothetical protein
MTDEAENNSSGNASPPEGRLYRQSLDIRTPQHVSLLKRWWRDIVDRARRRGRPPIDRAPYIALAEELIKGGVDPSQDALVGRLRSMLELKDKIPLELQDKIPELKKGLPVPGDTFLTDEICAPIYKREKSKK